MIRVCHLTSVHRRYDARIFHKECVSLQKAGYDIHLIVGDGLGDEVKQGVQISDVGVAVGGRAGRMLFTTSRILFRAVRVGARIFHFHDPELIPAGIVLRLLGFRVVYDVHEDVARSLENRPWVPSLIRKGVAISIESLECLAARILDLHMVVTPEIASRFPSRKTVLLRNFPIQAELRSMAMKPFVERDPVFAYVGTVSPDRGALIMVEAINHPLLEGKARLVIGGAVEPELIEKMMELDQYGLVTLRGHLTRNEIAQLLGSARAGLVLLQPVKAHMDAYPVKMFEYMAASLPVIASNYPLWAEILDQGELALLVDPTKPREIAVAMKAILDQPMLAERLALSGEEAVRTRYNWETEKNALLTAYGGLLSQANVRGE